MDRNCFRSVWEIRCGAPECQEVIRLEGPWTDQPCRTVSASSLREEHRKRGWIFQPARCISNHSHRIYVERSFYCPQHAPVITKYYETVKKWDQQYKTLRKTWWMKFKEFWQGGPCLEPPTKPW